MTCAGLREENGLVAAAFQAGAFSFHGGTHVLAGA